MRHFPSLSLLLLLVACQTNMDPNEKIIGRINLFGGPYNPTFAVELLNDQQMIVHKYAEGKTVSNKIGLTETTAKEIQLIWREAFYSQTPQLDPGRRPIMDGLKILISFNENGTLNKGEVIRTKGVQYAELPVRQLVERINQLISNEQFKIY
jgi:hypothetical protein